jgi:protein-tyrosine phosphatase
MEKKLSLERKKAMIDIHSHVLNQVDDGPLSLAESLALMQQAYENGVTDIITTPHSWAFAGEKNMDWLQERFDHFQNEAQKIPIQLYLGMEHAVDDYRRFVRKIDKEGLLTLAKSRYVLVEAMRLKSADEAEEFVYEMKLRGYFPILAHPERMSRVKKDTSVVRAFRKAGGFVQVTIEACDPKDSGMFHKAAMSLLKEKQIDFLATDMHGLIRSCKNLTSVIKRIEDYAGKDFVDTVTLINPKKVLLDQEIIKRR